MTYESILQGNCLHVLRRLPSEQVQCVVTSPPYYGLRSYLPDGHEDKDAEIGQEESPAAYIDRLVQVFREVRRVLRTDGTLWLNIGDSYAASRSYQVRDSMYRDVGNTRSSAIPVGLKPKDLMMIPARVALALQADGWYLRSDIIWHKPNCMPESVTDRPTSAHEHVFLLAKNERYYYDADAIRDPVSTIDRRGTSRIAYNGKGNPQERMFSGNATWLGQSLTGRNKRSVWTISTSSYADAHFATMPPKLVEPCILAGSRVGDLVLDPFCGAGTVPLVAAQHGRRYLGIELNAEYIRLAERRLACIQPHLWEVAS